MLQPRLGTRATGGRDGLAARRPRRVRPRPPAGRPPAARTDRFAGTPYDAQPAGRNQEVTSFDGTKLVVHERGPSQACAGLIFIHGICSDSRVWYHQFHDTPEPAWRQLRYDLRGHGTSAEVGGAPANLSTLAADLKAVIDASGLSQVVLVGHSMGAMTALTFATECPQEMATQVRGLVLANTTAAEALTTFPLLAHLGEASLRKGLDWLLADPRRCRHLRLHDDGPSRELVRLFSFGKHPSATQVAFVTHLVTAWPNPTMIQLLRSLLSYNVVDSLPAIKVPTLILASGRDRVTAPGASAHMAARIAGSRLALLPDSGHMAIMEEPERFAALLNEFAQPLLCPGPSSVSKTRAHRDFRALG